MRITESHLRRIIRQEVARTIFENRRRRGSRALYEGKSMMLMAFGLQNFPAGSWADELIDELTDIANSREEQSEKEKQLRNIKTTVEKEHPSMTKLREDAWLRFASKDYKDLEDAFRGMHFHLSNALKNEK